MKSVKRTFSTVAFGLLLGMAACNSNKNSEGMGDADSAGMDNSQTQMGTDTMMTDSIGADSAMKPL